MFGRLGSPPNSALLWTRRSFLPCVARRGHGRKLVERLLGAGKSAIPALLAQPHVDAAVVDDHAEADQGQGQEDRAADLGGAHAEKERGKDENRLMPAAAWKMKRAVLSSCETRAAGFTLTAPPTGQRCRRPAAGRGDRVGGDRAARLDAQIIIG